MRPQATEGEGDFRGWQAADRQDFFFVGSATGAVFRAGDDPEMGWLARGPGASVAGYLPGNCFAGSMVSAHLFVLRGPAGAVERLREQPQPVPEVLPATAPA